jgi:hypothetical protein
MVVLAFAVGWTGSTLSKAPINVGLVTALNSVLGNLLGETTAGAKIGVINPEVEPVNAVQIDVNTHTVTPVVFDVFYPPDEVMPSCTVMMQVRVSGDEIHAVYNERFTNIIVEPGIINPDVVPAPCHPPDPILPPGGDG